MGTKSASEISSCTPRSRQEGERASSLRRSPHTFAFIFGESSLYSRKNTIFLPSSQARHHRVHAEPRFCVSKRKVSGGIAVGPPDDCTRYSTRSTNRPRRTLLAVGRVCFQSALVIDLAIIGRYVAESPISPVSPVLAASKTAARVWPLLEFRKST
jgi:hypothetical protein